MAILQPHWELHARYADMDNLFENRDDKANWALDALSSFENCAIQYLSRMEMLYRYTAIRLAKDKRKALAVGFSRKPPDLHSLNEEGKAKLRSLRKMKQAARCKANAVFAAARLVKRQRESDEEVEVYWYMQRQSYVLTGMKFAWTA
jgi:hypothetical protein